MIDRLFSAVLAFCLLAGGTAAIGSALFEGQPAARSAATQIVELPRVVIVGQRTQAPVIELPRVVVVGQRATRQLAAAAPVEPVSGLQ